MEIRLKTHQDNQVFSISKMTEHSFVLYVNSYGFSGSSTFYHYDTSTIGRFIDDLADLLTSGPGVARLIDVESNELAFRLNKLGHLEVSGKLIPHSLPHQMLEFGFITDQTCLLPLVTNLKKARDTISSQDH